MSFHHLVWKFILIAIFSGLLSECECDIGGAYNNVCNKSASGQCECKENITQRQCNRFVVQTVFPCLYYYLFINSIIQSDKVVTQYNCTS